MDEMTRRTQDKLLEEALRLQALEDVRRLEEELAADPALAEAVEAMHARHHPQIERLIQRKLAPSPRRVPLRALAVAACLLLAVGVGLRLAWLQPPADVAAPPPLNSTGQPTPGVGYGTGAPSAQATPAPTAAAASAAVLTPEPQQATPLPVTAAPTLPAAESAVAATPMPSVTAAPTLPAAEPAVAATPTPQPTASIATPTPAADTGMDNRRAQWPGQFYPGLIPQGYRYEGTSQDAGRTTITFSAADGQRISFSEYTSSLSLPVEKDAQHSYVRLMGGQTALVSQTGSRLSISWNDQGRTLQVESTGSLERALEVANHVAPK